MSDSPTFSLSGIVAPPQIRKLRPLQVYFNSLYVATWLLTFICCVIAAQCQVVFKNMESVMKNTPATANYDGYASCPLVTGYDRCILAEFDYNLTPLETFPFNQGKELKSMYLMKKMLMPPLYWTLMLNGFWNGPAAVRNLLHLKFSQK